MCGGNKPLSGSSSIGLISSRASCLIGCCFILGKGLLLPQLEQVISFVLCLWRTLPGTEGGCQFPLVGFSDSHKCPKAVLVGTRGSQCHLNLRSLLFARR